MRYEKLENATRKIQGQAKVEVVKLTKNKSMHILKLRRELFREKIRNKTLEGEVGRKGKENDELSRICDELTNFDN